jgi:hypothetical protein
MAHWSGSWSAAKPNMRVLDPNHRHPFSSGIPVILAAPIIAVDLSLLVLVWEGSQGRTWLSYNNPEYLKKSEDAALCSKGLG